MNAPTRQHTPGPWTVRISQNGALRGYSIEHQDETLRSIVARNWEHELCEEHGNSLPNARLIASAPDLLSACMSALRALEDNLQPGPMDEDAKEGLRAAIEKATVGEE